MHVFVRCRGSSAVSSAVSAFLQVGWPCTAALPRRYISTPYAGGAPNLERRIARLKSVLNSLAHPRLESFVSGGSIWELPVRQRDPVRRPSEEELHYCVGFFDGDGCVTSNKNLGSISLSVSQSVDQAEVLLLFLRAFGGGIRRHGSGSGARKPTISWYVTSTRIKHAARLLGSIPSCKQQQLLIAAQSAPDCAQARAKLATQLRCLKRHEHLGELSVSWAYVAGFFDAEGHLGIWPSWCGLNLRIKQKQSAPLFAIQSFMSKELPEVQTYIYQCSKSGMYSWSVYNTAACRLVLLRLLRAGLINKRQVAELAVTCDSSNFLFARNEFARLKGNQSRYVRLDDDGCRRSREIRLLRNRIWYHEARENLVELQELQQRLSVLTQQHARLRAVAVIQLLRRDVRMLLSAGARRICIRDMSPVARIQ